MVLEIYMYGENYWRTACENNMEALNRKNQINSVFLSKFHLIKA